MQGFLGKPVPSLCNVYIVYSMYICIKRRFRVLHYYTRGFTVEATGLLATPDTVSHGDRNFLQSQLVWLVRQTPFTDFIVTEVASVAINLDIGEDVVKLPQEKLTLSIVFLLFRAPEFPGAKARLFVLM